MVRQAEEKERCPAVQGRSPGDIYTTQGCTWTLSSPFDSLANLPTLFPGAKKARSAEGANTRRLPFPDEGCAGAHDGSSEAAQTNAPIWGGPPSGESFSSEVLR